MIDRPLAFEGLQCDSAAVGTVARLKHELIETARAIRERIVGTRRRRQQFGQIYAVLAQRVFKPVGGLLAKPGFGPTSIGVGRQTIGRTGIPQGAEFHSSERDKPLARADHGGHGQRMKLT